MIITRTSPWNGKVNTRDLPVTEEQMERFANRADYIQNIFPDLSVGDREFILTGYTEQDWEELFPEDDDEA